MRLEKFCSETEPQIYRVKLLLANQGTHGYMVFHCRDPEGNLWPRTLHSIIAETFHGPRPEGMVIDHINGDCLDNRACNLRYVTQSENLINRMQRPNYGIVQEPSGWRVRFNALDFGGHKDFGVYKELSDALKCRDVVVENRIKGLRWEARPRTHYKVPERVGTPTLNMRASTDYF